MMSHGLILVPVLYACFNENAAPTSLPAQAVLGNILKIAAPLVYQTVQRAQVTRLSQTALSGWLGRNRLNSYVANLERETGD